MKKLILLLFSLFFFCSTSIFADDISDFHIEKISVGDSLMDYMTEDEIIEAIESSPNDYSYLKEPNKYVQVNLIKEFPTYKSGLSFFIKNNLTNTYVGNKNEKYTIELIAGRINFTEDFDSCIAKRDEIAEILSSMFPDAQKVEGEYAHSADPSGNSIIDGVWFTFDEGAEISTYCSNHEETFRSKMDWTEGLKVTIANAEVATWLMGRI